MVPFVPRPRARVLAAVPPGSGAAVMATGIVSVALGLDGRHTASAVLMWITVAIWGALAMLALARFVADPAGLRAQATDPATLTGVAGTAVLGSRLAMQGWAWAGIVLLALAAIAWAPVLAAVLRHWPRPSPGSGFLTAVSAQSLAVLAAGVARQ